MFGTFILKLDELLLLGVPTKTAAAMDGIRIDGAPGFFQTHDIFLKKAVACRATGNRAGESAAYSMASWLRLYTDREFGQQACND